MINDIDKQRIEELNGSAVSVWRAIAEVKQRWQRSLIEWVAKNLLS
jgi:hypothetical protein